MPQNPRAEARKACPFAPDFVDFTALTARPGGHGASMRAHALQWEECTVEAPHGMAIA